jgi:hypothetical protein
MTFKVKFGVCLHVTLPYVFLTNRNFDYCISISIYLLSNLSCHFENLFGGELYGVILS